MFVRLKAYSQKEWAFVFWPSRLVFCGRLEESG
jgi:hypothetical protein